jgi:peroxiredoxin
MAVSSDATRRKPGMMVAPRVLTTVAGAEVPLPDRRHLVHLQFRRFAGCPVCSLHLRAFVRRADDLGVAGIREVVVFHSPAEELAAYAADLPFSLIADPDKRLYKDFGVESAPRALLDPRGWPAIARSVALSAWSMIGSRHPVPPLVPHGGRLGLPADFLIGPDGRILAAHYGAHVDDAWTVEEVLALGEAARPSQSAASHARAEPATAADSRAIDIAARSVRYGVATLILTSLHHAYGAIAFDTPWRLHVLPPAMAASVTLVGLLALARRSSSRLATVALYSVGLVGLIIAGGLFGVYEGGYNHVLKNVLYFSGVPRGVLDRFYDPSLYVLPTDPLFEVTGVLQFVAGLAAAAWCLRLLCHRDSPCDNPVTIPAPASRRTPTSRGSSTHTAASG